MALFAKGLHRAVWIKTTTDDKNWSGWNSIGGETDFAPAVINIAGGIFWVFRTGTDSHVYFITSLDGRDWGPWRERGGGGVTIAAPAATWRDILVAGTDQGVWIKGLDSTLPFTKLPPGDLLTTQGLCMMEYRNPDGSGQFFDVAFGVGTDQKIYQNVYNNPWNVSLPTGQWIEVPGNGATNVALAVARLPGTAGACLFATGLDNKIYVNVNCPLSFGDIHSWSGWSEVDGGGRTDVALAAVTENQASPDSLYLFAKGLNDDHRIYVNIAQTSVIP